MNKEDFFYDATVALCAKPEYAFAREPVLRRMADGSLISTALSGGPGEPHEDNFVLSVRSEDEGKRGASLKFYSGMENVLCG